MLTCKAVVKQAQCKYMLYDHTGYRCIFPTGGLVKLTFITVKARKIERGEMLSYYFQSKRRYELT